MIGGHAKHLKLILYTYLGVVFAVLLLVFFLAVLPMKHINCVKEMFSNKFLLTFVGYHWFIVCTLDLFQALLIIAISYYLVKHIKSNMNSEL